MLKLSNDLYIAEGKTKVCYQHPLDSSKVIKINKPDSSYWQHKRWVTRFNLEIRVLKKVSCIDDVKHYFPSYYGVVKTNIGLGHIFQKVDNAVDIFNSDYRISSDVFSEIITVIRSLIKHSIPFHMDLAKNVFIDEKSKKIYFVDSLGSNTFIPVTMLPMPRCCRLYLMSNKIKKNINHLKIIKKNNVDLSLTRN